MIPYEVIHQKQQYYHKSSALKSILDKPTILADFVNVRPFFWIKADHTLE